MEASTMEDKHVTRILESGSSIDAIGGVAAVVLAIVGLSNVAPVYMVAIAAIVLGATLIFQSGLMSAEYNKILSGLEEKPHLEFGGGLGAEGLAGSSGVILGVLALFALYATARSLTRGAWIYVPVAGVIMFFCFRSMLLSRKRVLVLIMALIVLLGLWAYRSSSVADRIDQTFSSMETFARNPAVSTSLGERLNLWRNSVLIWENHPFIGTGLGDFKRDNQKLIAEGRSINDSIGVYGHAHNIYFDSLATMGLLGLFAVIVAIVVLPFRFFLRHWRQAQGEWPRFYALGGMLSVAGFATFGLTEHWLGRNPFVNPYIFYVLTFAISLSVRNLSDSDVGKRSPVGTTEAMFSNHTG